MASGLAKPRVTKNPRTTALSYELPHRIHTAKVYPVKSSNGSTIILYGHEHGVRIVWRGGRPFKQTPPPSTQPPKTNGDTAMISLDSDDEDEKFEDKPEFEDEEDELDPLNPYPNIIQSLDLHFGIDVLQLAILPNSTLTAEGSKFRGIEPLKKKIVFTAACADNSLKLVTLPLTPPSPLSKNREEFRKCPADAYAGKGNWGETITNLTGHEKPSDGVSMTVDFNNSNTSQTKSAAQIIIASSSGELTGLLRFYRVSIKAPQKRADPFQKINLAALAKSISFNPSLSGQRANQLLVADKKGACRVYDYKELITTPDIGVGGAVLEHGTWLISLYTRFQNPKSESTIPQTNGPHTGFGRKSIIDAQWVSGGKSIIVLLADGEWGVWDIEGTGATQSESRILLAKGVKTGSQSEFTFSGYIDMGLKTRQPKPAQTTSKFAPMTPSTRKSVDIFTSKPSNGTIRGQISVFDYPSSSPTHPPEQSIIFWLGETYTQISSLARYWATNKDPSKNSGSIFNSSSTSRMVRLEGVDLKEERCSGIGQIPNSSSTDSPSDLVVLGESRLAIVISAKQSSKDAKVLATAGRLAMAERASANIGPLDVVGIDQALARMENGNSLARVKLF
ncbi:hypothetical protein HYFRA_00003006 [Hymenoscyphus fraxineus]|uniref:Nucleoporin NUP37 n=1 Tax=Hymenoscyphus fraxineus TaxID=746836 RepID=A0A9N9KPK9_9HELO|nr:hypothetical protein HYFRA_00003006 [Hymenoscyphus fraxineus]